MILWELEAFFPSEFYLKSLYNAYSQCKVPKHPKSKLLAEAPEGCPGSSGDKPKPKGGKKGGGKGKAGKGKGKGKK